MFLRCSSSSSSSSNSSIIKQQQQPQQQEKQEEDIIFVCCIVCEDCVYCLCVLFYTYIINKGKRRSSAQQSVKQKLLQQRMQGKEGVKVLGDRIPAGLAVLMKKQLKKICTNIEFMQRERKYPKIICLVIIRFFLVFI